jgi:hypothetical protein
MHADAADCGLLAKRGLSASLHAIICDASASKHLIYATRAFRGALSPDFAKNAGETPCALDGADPPAMSGKSPLLTNSLTPAGFRANSRFLTDCYL